MSYPQQPQPPYGQQPSGPPYQPMSPPPPYYATQPPPPQADSSKKFLNMSGGMLMIVGAVVLVVCCLGPLALCAFGGVFGSIGDAAKPNANVTLTGCKIDDDGIARTAEVTYTIKNPGKSEGDYLVEFVVVDAADSQVGEGSDWVFNLAGGASKTASNTVYLDAAGGTTCKVRVK